MTVFLFDDGPGPYPICDAWDSFGTSKFEATSPESTDGAEDVKPLMTQTMAAIAITTTIALTTPIDSISIAQNSSKAAMPATILNRRPPSDFERRSFQSTVTMTAIVPNTTQRTKRRAAASVILMSTIDF